MENDGCILKVIRNCTLFEPKHASVGHCHLFWKHQHFRTTCFSVLLPVSSTQSSRNEARLIALTLRKLFEAEETKHLACPLAAVVLWIHCSTRTRLNSPSDSMVVSCQMTGGKPTRIDTQSQLVDDRNTFVIRKDRKATRSWCHWQMR